MTPIQIIVAATNNAAHVCNLENVVGTLEKGKSADLLVVDGNSLENIEVLSKTRMVINRGELIFERKKSTTGRKRIIESPPFRQSAI